ncbi:MAG: bifunctional oligoribonuclease/PAP phosphatase NrnA [Firmicutes bacterium]|nr:bifunctional oligoribonuclease/PAP phosphatase NrnA [Bacillota bacterium]
MKNSFMKEPERMRALAQLINSSDSILLFPHSKMDGDAAGSCGALCAALRNQGKQAYVFADEVIPDNLKFLVKDFVTDDPRTLEQPDLCMAVDCGEAGRFEKRKDVFFRGHRLACLDHHEGGGQFDDAVCYVDPESASCGELMFALLTEMGAEITPFMADALYGAITTDTGNFRFSNAKKETHEIVARLYDCGLNHAAVCNEIYDNERIEKLRLHALAIADMEMVAEGCANIVCVTQEMLKKTGAEMWETEGLIDTMRSVAGVEISALLKEDEPEKIKISLRAKSYGEVLTIAGEFGGGGHRKAAGGTIRRPIGPAKEMVKDAICRWFQAQKAEETKKE